MSSDLFRLEALGERAGARGGAAGSPEHAGGGAGGGRGGPVGLSMLHVERTDSADDVREVSDGRCTGGAAAQGAGASAGGGAQ